MMAQNSCTVIGVFDDYGSAENVARDLEGLGIPKQSIHVKSNFKTGAAGRSDYGEERSEGGISGFFHRLFGGGHEDSGHYDEAVRRGSAVVAVVALTEQADRAAQMMTDRGAIDIDRRVEEYRKLGYDEYDANAPAYSREEAVRERNQYRDVKEGTSVPVVEEELEVGKREVLRGGVRVYSRVVEKPVEQSVELREEHVRVERRPVNRALEKGEADRFREQSIEVTETAEEPVVRKRARVREEVVVGKETTKRTENIHDTVRRTEVEVEPLKAREDYSDDYRRDYDANYARSGDTYEAMLPAYKYGSTLANDARYRGKNWSDVEDEVRTDYLRNNPASSWDRMKGAIRYAWERVTGKR
ncbi:MAG: hypothetical protein JWP63_5080 [Candidatus Solibacter sp.]|nr:hypothetical protein [Candidatus Solibacter sp.]